MGPGETTPSVVGSGGEQPGDVGQISLQLTLGNGLRFDQVAYVINGHGIQRTGSITVGASSTISAVVESLPVGAGYVATLTAMDLDHRVSSCDGSSTFDVGAAATTPVMVHLICKEAALVAPASAPVPPLTKLFLGLGLWGFGAWLLRRREHARGA